MTLDLPPPALDHAGQVLTGRPAVAAWPELASVIHTHVASCGRSENLADAEPVSVFVFELLTAAPERNGVAERQLPETDL